MDSVVISGATGFIGRHLVTYFSENNIEVYALTTRDLSTHYNTDCKIHYVRLDLNDYNDYISILPQNPLAFIHLAWNGVSPEMRNSVDVQYINVDLSLKAAHLASKLNAQRFVLPGSTMEYVYSGNPINRHTQPCPQDAYSAAKIASRYLCESLCRELNMPFIYAVITGIYSADRKDNNVIHYTISSLLNGEVPHLTKLEQKWDYVYISDVARAFYLISVKGRPGAFYSIGTGESLPLYKYICLIRDIIDPNLRLGIGDIPYKNGQLPCSCVDLSELTKDTGYEPSVPFAVGIREVIDTMKKEVTGSD